MVSNDIYKQIMNIRKSQLREMIKAVAREAINERKEKFAKTKKVATPNTSKNKHTPKKPTKSLKEGENPFKGKEKKENPFKKKEKEEPEEFETPEDSDEKSLEEPTDAEAPTNMVSDEEPEDTESDSTEPEDGESDGAEPVGPPEDIGGGEEPNEESHGYDEKEEILLIKVLEKAVQKLLDMHKGMEGSEEEEEPPVDVGEPEGEEIPIGEPSIDSGEPEGEEIPIEEPPVDAGGAEGEEAPVEEPPVEPEGEEDEGEQGLEEGGSVQYESAPPGFGPGKAHADIYNKVEAQYGKDSPKKYATLWKIYNQMTEVANAALEECGGMEEAGLTSEDSEAKATPLDDIVRLVKNKGLEDPEKEKYLVSRLFKHQTGWDVDPQTLEKALQQGNTEETLNEASYKVASPTQARCAADDHAREIQTDPEVTEGAVNELSPELANRASKKAAGRGDARGNRLATKFSKYGADKSPTFMAHIAGRNNEVPYKIQNAHRSGEVIHINTTDGKYISIDLHQNTARYGAVGGGQPEAKVFLDRRGAVAITNLINKKRPEGTFPIGPTQLPLKEDSYKVAAPHSYTDAAEDKARTIQTDPEVNEMFAAGENNTCPRCQTSLKESDEGKLRCDNPTCDCSKKLYEFTKRNFKEPEIKENHKIQARSYTTANDGAQDPKNVRDPEVPGP